MTHSKTNTLFNHRPLGIVGFILMATFVGTGIIFLILPEEESLPPKEATFILLTLFGLLLFYLCFKYAKIIVTSSHLILKRWSKKEIFNRIEDIRRVEFLEKDVIIHTGYGQRKIPQFERKRIEFSKALLFQNPHLSPIDLQEELRKGEIMRYNQMLDGILLGIIISFFDWPIFILIIIFVNLPTLAVLLLLISPLFLIVFLIWYRGYLNKHLESLKNRNVSILQ